MKRLLFCSMSVITLCMLLLWACGPKAAQETQKSANVATSTANKVLNSDSVSLNADAQIGGDAGKYGADSSTTVTQYSLYREYYKQKLYADALPYWRYVYANAPALRKNVYYAGVKMYENLAKAASDSAMHQAYVDTFFMVYDQRVQHFGEEGIVLAWKARKLKKYRPWEKELYNEWVHKSVDIQQEESDHFVLWPYFKQYYNKLRNKTIALDDLKEVQAFISTVTEYNINNEHEKAEKYEAVQLKVDEIIAKIDDVTDMSCEGIRRNHVPKYEASPNDVAVVKDLFRKMVGSKCQSDPLYQTLKLKLADLEPTASRCKMAAQYYYNNNDIPKTEQYLKQALELEQNATKQATIYMFLANIERRKVSDLTPAVATQARKYAKKAAELNPGWGKPYLFIGDLYASSGPLCGTGRGWNSQVVSWAATDMWERAKDVDPSISSEANKSINKYKRFYPTVADGHMRSIKNGQRYKIGCWIGTSTTVRLIQ